MSVAGRRDRAPRARRSALRGILGRVNGELAARDWIELAAVGVTAIAAAFAWRAARASWAAADYAVWRDERRGLDVLRAHVERVESARAIGGPELTAAKLNLRGVIPLDRDDFGACWELTVATVDDIPRLANDARGQLKDALDAHDKRKPRRWR